MEAAPQDPVQDEDLKKLAWWLEEHRKLRAGGASLVDLEPARKKLHKHAGRVINHLLGPEFEARVVLYPGRRER